VSWLWVFLPVALVIIAAVVGLPLWQSMWSRGHHEDATPQSRPEHVHH
jgi:hypothetical protein